jgi:hypothetical protein
LEGKSKKAQKKKIIVQMIFYLPAFLDLKNLAAMYNISYRMVPAKLGLYLFGKRY